MAEKKAVEQTATAEKNEDERPAVKSTPVMCTNHPDRRAEHTTTTTAHEPISLCGACLNANPDLRDR